MIYLRALVIGLWLMASCSNNDSKNAYSRDKLNSTVSKDASQIQRNKFEDKALLMDSLEIDTIPKFIKNTFSEKGNQSEDIQKEVKSDIIPSDDEQNSTKDHSNNEIESKVHSSYNGNRILLKNIKFEALEFVYDTVTEGDIVKYDFNFTNHNKVPIEVESTYPDCGCTLPSFPFLPIESGASGFIGVTFNSVGKNGQQESSIHLKFKKIKEEVILKLKGFVKEKK